MSLFSFGKSRRSDRRLRRTQLVACDLDGTLLDRDEMIGPKTASLIRHLVDSGVPFVIMTARHHHAVEPYAELLRLQGPIVSLDGGLIRSIHGSSPEFTIPLEQDQALEILDSAEKEPLVSFCAVTAERFYLSDPDFQIPSRHLHWNVETTPFERADDLYGGILEIIVMGGFEGVNRILRTVKEQRGRGDGTPKVRLYESRSRGERWYLEILPAEANKAVALRHLADLYGIAMKDIVGIGDDRNDLQFCGDCGYVVAVSDAIPELIEIADFITESTCDDDAVGEFLQHFLSIRGIDVGTEIGRRGSNESLWTTTGRSFESR